MANKRRRQSSTDTATKVSIDKVAMWADHDIKTCREHYARFVPKDKKDRDIDKLGRPSANGGCEDIGDEDDTRRYVEDLLCETAEQ